MPDDEEPFTRADTIKTYIVVAAFTVVIVAVLFGYFILKDFG
jgi:hypothetical protein